MDLGKNILQITTVKKRFYSQEPIDEQTIQVLKCHLLVDILTESLTKFHCND